jgi:hypothetical protein
MRIQEVIVDWIFGFSVGFSIAPVGVADDEEGYVIIDLAVMRFIVVYT